MHPPPLLRRCRPVDGRAHERVAKPHTAVDLDQSGQLRRLECRAGDRESLSRTPHERRIAAGLRRSHQQEALGVLRQRLEPLLEALLDPTLQREGARQPEPARELRRRQSTRKLQQRQRVPASLSHDLVGDALVQPPRNHRGQKVARRPIAQAFDHQLRQAREFLARLANPEQHHHRLRSQPAPHERQHLRRGSVQPLRVVDHAHERALLGRLRQQTKRRQADEEPIRHRALAQPERGRQGIALRARESLEPLEQRHAELVQRREGKLHLGLHPGGANPPHVRGRAHRMLQQRRLADPGLALQHEDPAAPTPRALEQPVEDGALVSPTAQHRL